MAQPLVSRIGASPLWRAGLASAFILGLAGFAAGVVPQACRSGFVICNATGASAGGQAEIPAPVAPKAAPVSALEDVASVTEVTPESSPTAVAAIDMAILEQAPASLTRNDLIAQTFAALDVELTTTTPTELTARKVRTVSIGPDGMPVIEGAAPSQVAAGEPDAAVDEPAPIELEVAELSEPVSAEQAAPDTEAAGPEEEPTASAYAPVRGGSAVIGRQGANVRSLPKTSGSQVLFALASGEEVTIMETSKGWSKVVDTRGRSGWIWGELLRR